MQFKTKEEMIDFLRKGGVDVDTFDQQSPKKLDELFAETKKREVILSNNYRGRVCRIAMTVKVLLYAEGRYLLKERYRIYPNGRRVEKHDPGSFSETRIQGERSDETVIRGMREECGIEVTKKDLVLIPDSPEMPRRQEYESKAYAGLLTLAHVEWMAVTLPKRPWEEKYKFLEDNGTKIFVEWEEDETMGRFDDLLHQLDQRTLKSAS